MAITIGSLDHLDAIIADADDKLIVVDFLASSSGSCDMPPSKYKELAEAFPDVIFLMVNYDYDDEIAIRLGVSSTPSFIFIKYDTVIGKMVGITFNELNKGIQKHH